MPRVVIGNVSTARLPRCNSLLRPRLIGCTFRAYISISRLLFDFLKNGGFRPLHRLTNMRVWLVLHLQYVLINSIFISEFRK